ncbi:(2Fe-2S)-binding protein [Halanaerobium hydrogeniformans]|uniref:BFD domain protein (2Fe-2S)-binding domain protein n=1 Tax=Halanaerobium hydrogeniformans TaxID=656519 RepID=E4RP07_HALHG|nr:(2Fe-2S)-binding protein [Halanaerobium hydrogeniformans]ADQ13697.1 BFD domain protein (2Fe-2S)-binding domain protein [Halanaerobium hydrogeniformans]
MDKRLVRSFKKEAFIKKDDDQMIICRCEEITKGEIRKAIHQGMLKIDELKKYLRTGMGLCQGRTCTKLIKRIMAEELKVAADEFKDITARAPLRPIKMEVYANDDLNNCG